MIVTIPRSGHPVAFCRATINSSKDMPIITSGITSGALVMAENKNRPVNFL